MKTRSAFIPVLTLALALLAAAVFAAPVLAQDEVPTEVPAEPAPVVEETPVEASAEIPAASAGTEVPAEIPVEEAPVEATPLETLAEEGLTLVDGSGEPMALAAEETAGALAVGDVWFKVGTTTYWFNVGDCDPGPDVTSCPTPIQAAIDYIGANATIPSDGTIHVDASTTLSDQVIVFDGSLNANINKIKALVGAVSTTTFLPTVTLNGTSTITIDKMTNGTGFLLSGFNIHKIDGTDGIKVVNSSGPLKLIDLDISGIDSTALYIEKHNGTIELTNVNVHDNDGTGTLIFNYDNPTSTYNTGAITINNSSFDRNGGDGVYGSLSIRTGGAVTLKGVTVNNNSFGLHIVKAGNVTIKDSVFNNNFPSSVASISIADQSGDQIFDEDIFWGNVVFDNVVVNNNNVGISVITHGNITANKILVNNNASLGAIFNTCGSFGDCYPYYYGKVAITNSNFDDNGGSEMLRIWSRGAVVLTNVSASGNTTGAGALVHTNNSLLVTPVTITGGTFNDNATYGMEVLSKGTITLSKVSASGNPGGYGAKLVNDYTGATAGVVIKGTLIGDNIFDSNNNGGLYIRTNGTVTLSYLSASGNGGMGLNLNKDVNGVGAVTITKGTFDNNGAQGMVVKSKGAIKLTTISASGNGSQGANLQNTLATAAPGVTITGGDFNHNQGTGLYVRSKGAIALKTTQAYGNSVHEMDFPTGVYTVHDVFEVEGGVDTWMVDVTTGMVGPAYDAILSSAHANGILEIRDPLGNIDYSAFAISSGDLYVATITDFTFDEEGAWTFQVRDNSTYLPVGYFLSSDVFGATTGDEWFGYTGADLDNTGGTAGVTIANAAFPKYEWGEIIPERDFNSNNAVGLLIRTNGAVSVTSVVAYGNGSFGVNINNAPPTGTATPNVTLTNGRFIANGDTGLEVLTEGGITAKNIGSAWNAAIGNAAVGKGAHLVTTTAGKTVSIVNLNSTEYNYVPGFENNMANGLEISSLGAVTLTNVRAFENETGDGISVVTSGGSGNITLTNVSVTYSRNGYGILIDNHLGAGNVTINGGYAADNELDGIHIETKGSIILNKVYAEYNRGMGAYLDNGTSSSYPSVTITNMPLASNIDYLGFNANDFGGLKIVSRGLVTLNNVIAGWNTGNGATIENNNGPYDVRINSGIFNENMDDGVIGGFGLKVTSMGSIIINTGAASGNFLRGADLDNVAGGGPIKPVTITNFSFDDNTATGLGILSNGVVTLTNVGASGNTNYGANISTAGNVFVKYSGKGTNTFDGNGYSGLNIRTSGTVYLAKVNAVGNTGGYGTQIGETAARVSNVTVLSSSFDQNSMSGLLVYSLGTVTLNGVSAFDNTVVGAYIWNDDTASPKNIVVSKGNFVENAQGLVVRSMGMVTLNGITSLDNGIGADINNTYGTAGVSVLSTLGANTFNGNSSRGLYIRSKGNVIVNTTTASENGSNGIEIENYQGGSGTGYVLLTKVTTWSNIERGVYISSNNYVTIDGLSALMNGTNGQPYAGVYVSSNLHNLTIKNSLIVSNVAYGIYAKIGTGVFSILNTYYYGNNTSDTGYPNIYLEP